MSSGELASLLARLKGGEFDAAVEALERRRLELHWARLPSRIILLRHGESEGNVGAQASPVPGHPRQR